MQYLIRRPTLEVEPNPFVDILPSILLLLADSCLPENDIARARITKALLHTIDIERWKTPAHLSSESPARWKLSSTVASDSWLGWDSARNTTTCSRYAGENRAGFIPRLSIFWKIDGKRYLVAPRGRTQWVRNAEATGEIALKRGSWRQSFRLRAVPDAEKPELLKAYLDRFKLAVQRYFPVAAGSEAQAFAAIAPNYPVFELIESPNVRTLG